MANKYARAVGGNWDSDATWSTTDGGGADTTKPTSSDDVFLTATSGQVTINAAANCKSLTCTGYTNTLTHNTFALNTFGNIVFVSGMTYTQVTGAYINFSSAGTLTTGGKTMPSLIATNKITLGDNVTFSAAKTLYVKLDSSGTALDLNGKILSGGSSINRVLIYSGTTGTSKTLLVNSGSFANADFQDVNASDTWDASSQTDIGDCGGNSGITFPASVAQTWSGTSGGNWSTNAWTTRVPLPQDDVTISSAFSASQTVTADMPRLGRSIDWTGATGSPVFALGLAISIYGSLIFVSGMTCTGNFLITFSGRSSSYEIITNGVSIAGVLAVIALSGTYSLGSALTLSNSFNGISVSAGTFNQNGFTIQCSTIAYSSNNGARVLNLDGSIILTATGTTNIWTGSTSGATLNASTSTISILSASANTRSFLGAGQTYGTLTYTVAGSTGQLNITGSNSFAQINFSDVTNARSLKFTAGTTTTIRNSRGFNVQGTSGKLMTVSSITGATHTLSSANRQVCSYLNVSYSIASAGLFYAQTTSTDGGNNTGWIFTDAPVLSVGGGSNGIQNRMNLQNLRSLI